MAATRRKFVTAAVGKFRAGLAPPSAMRRTHWAFLATVAFAVPIAGFLGVVLVPDPTGPSVPLTIAAGTVGVIVSGLLVYGGGFDRLGVSAPGKGALVDLGVVFPAALVGAWLMDRPPLRGVQGFVLFLGTVVAGQRLATEVRDRVVATDDGRSTDGGSRP